MPIVANSFTRYDAVGNREDLANIIYNVDPTDTPFMSTVGRTTALNTLHEWQTDTLAAAAQNAQLEGDTFTNDSLSATARVSNFTQIARKVIGVTGTQLAMNPAGRANELSYQLEKASQAIKRDMEFDLMRNQTPGNGGKDSSARTLRPFLGWLSSNVNGGTGWAAGTSSAAFTPGTARAFTEDMLKDVLKKIFDNSGERPNKILTDSYNRGVFSSFTGGNQRQQFMEEKKLTATVQVYEGDYGIYQIEADRFMLPGVAAVITPDMAAVAYLRPFEVQEIAKTSDSERRALVCEYTLEVRNEKAHGAVFDLTTSA